MVGGSGLKIKWKVLIVSWVCMSLICGNSYPCYGMEVEISSPSCILIEASTGTVIYEVNADERRSPASITKIMTLLLIMESLEEGTIHMDDAVTTSAYAKSMGGSQVFLEEGEIQTVDTLIKCIAVASGNDASVVMAEFIGGSEAAFVEKMNAKAKQLGMENTHFEDCCGLSDSDNHYTSAKDVSIMSRELVTNYPQIYEYTGIWMEDIVHETRKGSETFTLSSTNKLLKTYAHATGLKTGSTSKAKYCLSATAKKDNVELIAVIMAAPDYIVRFSDAVNLLEYGFRMSQLYIDQNDKTLPNIEVTGGVESEVEIFCNEEFRYLYVGEDEIGDIRKIIEVPESIEAPVMEGEQVGKVVYKMDENTIGSVSITAKSGVKEAFYKDYLKKVSKGFLL